MASSLVTPNQPLATGEGSGDNRYYLQILEPLVAAPLPTRLAATPDIVQRMHNFIRTELMLLFHQHRHSIPILYGGSTTPENIGAIMEQPNVGGALVGSTSLELMGTVTINSRRYAPLSTSPVEAKRRINGNDHH